MPNWCQNTIVVRGEQKDLMEFQERVRTLDFNQIIPMPEILKNTVSGGKQFDDKYVTSWIREPGGKHRIFTAEEEEQLRRLGFFNWFDWRVVNWGTKWNPTKENIQIEKLGADLIYRFDTAWTPPVPIIRKLSEMFPALKFKLTYQEEGTERACSLAF